MALALLDFFNITPGSVHFFGTFPGHGKFSTACELARVAASRGQKCLIASQEVTPGFLKDVLTKIGADDSQEINVMTGAFSFDMLLEAAKSFDFVILDSIFLDLNESQILSAAKNLQTRFLVLEQIGRQEFSEALKQQTPQWKRYQKAIKPHGVMSAFFRKKGEDSIITFHRSVFEGKKDNSFLNVAYSGGALRVVENQQP